MKCKLNIDKYNGLIVYFQALTENDDILGLGAKYNSKNF